MFELVFSISTAKRVIHESFNFWYLINDIALYRISFKWFQLETNETPFFIKIYLNKKIYWILQDCLSQQYWTSTCRQLSSHLSTTVINQTIGWMAQYVWFLVWKMSQQIMRTDFGQWMHSFFILWLINYES